MLSEKKAKFLTTKHTEEKISLEYVKATIEKYRSKYGIEIYMCGTSKYGIQLINERKKKVNAFFAILEKDETLRYAYYVQRFFKDRARHSDRDFDHYISKNNHSQLMSRIVPKYDEIRAAIYEFMEGEAVKQELTATQLALLNEKLKPYHQLLKPIINAYTPMHSSAIETAERITQQDAMQEMKYIQSTLKEGQFCSYIFATLLVSWEYHHIECVILGKDVMIKPAYSLSNDKLQNETLDNDVFYVSPSYNSFFLKGLSFRIHPQADKSSCAVIALLYSKILLRDNAAALLNFSLLYEICHENGKIEKVFIPAPQPLVYSQSGSYNSTIHDTLAWETSSHYVSFDNGEKTGTIKTLCGALVYTITNATQTSKADMITATTALSNKLPEFKVKWLKEYEKVNATRRLMNDADGINRYLMYKAHDFSAQL